MKKNMFRTFRGKRSIASSPEGGYYCRHACCVTVSPEECFRASSTVTSVWPL